MAVRHHRVLCALTTTILLTGCTANNADAGAASPAAPPTMPAATAATDSPQPTTPTSRTQKWIDLQVGDCVADLPPADLSRITVTTTDCETTHLAEVYLRAPVPVDSAIATVANRECAAGFRPYTGHPVAGSHYSVTYFIDSHQDRTGADPTPSIVICLLQATNGQRLTRSAHR
ncbi:hypothetical protein [Mycobacterium sp.]|uniref:hypothetical protein n=1 Tax=Mycobacterium sp. TaxID=1785 RepID=UPI003BAD38BB